MDPTRSRDEMPNSADIDLAEIRRSSKISLWIWSIISVDGRAKDLSGPQVYVWLMHGKRNVLKRVNLFLWKIFALKMERKKHLQITQKGFLYVSSWLNNYIRNTCVRYFL
jgi:hypothetical protein